jgi:[protein-PII] uridylyltransferase
MKPMTLAPMNVGETGRMAVLPSKTVSGSTTAVMAVSWKERREDLRACIPKALLAKIGEEEIEAHFSNMPERYWERMTERDLEWALETVHGFLSLISTSQVPPTRPFVKWRPGTQSGSAQMMLCTWDRHGLLAKAAACFSAVRLDIVEAEVFTRRDNIVLDIFTVIDADRRSIPIQAQLQEMTFLLEGALSEPPRFASIWACSRHKFLAPAPQISAEIRIDNVCSAVSTVVHVKASNRLGLLYDILETIADKGFDVVQARISTADSCAQDTIHITDADGHRVVDASRLEALQRSLEAALT